MKPRQIAHHLAEQFADRLLATHADDPHPRVHVDAAQWRNVAEHLHGHDELAMDWLACITGVDYPADNRLCAVYDLRSTRHGHWFAVKVYVDRDNPHVHSVSDLWPAADWHEREAHDLLGIVFDHHPDLRRILLPEDWVGHPLRKDYAFPRSYHGIPGTYELDWQQKPDYPA